MGRRPFQSIALCALAAFGLSVSGCTYSSGPLIDLTGGDRDGGDGMAGGDASSFFGDVMAPMGAPTLDAPPVVFATSGSQTTIDVTATDPDGEDVTITWQVVSGPDNVVLAPDEDELDITLPDVLDSVTLIRVQACDVNGDCSPPRRIRVIATSGFGIHGFVAPPPVGSDSNDGTVRRPWATIPHALSELELQDPAQYHTVYVAEGVYNEALFIPSSTAIVGGYSEDFTTRNLSTRFTNIIVAGVSAIEFSGSSSEIRGIHVSVTAGPAPPTATIILNGAEAAIRQSFVEIPTSPGGDAVGILVDGGPGAGMSTLSTKSARIYGGDALNINDTVVGIRVADPSGNSIVSIDDTNIEVGPSPLRPSMKGIEAPSGAIVSVFQSFIEILDAPAGTAAALHIARGIEMEVSGSLTLSGSDIVLGQDFTRGTGVEIAGNIPVVLLGSFIQSSDTVNLNNVFSTALSVSGGGSVSATNSDLRSGHLTGGTLLTSKAVRINEGSLDADDTNFLAGEGTESIGIDVVASGGVRLMGGFVNTDDLGNDSCVSSGRCVGIRVTFTDGTNVNTTPDPVSLSCCSRSVHRVILEGTKVVGGDAPVAQAVLVEGNQTTTCIDRSYLLAGTCAGNAPAFEDCVALQVDDTTNFVMHNTILYGGNGPNTTGARLVAPPAGARLVVANNYIHGGGLDGAAGDISIGLRLDPQSGGGGTEGVDLRNNHIEAVGSSPIAVNESMMGADPGIFLHNNLQAPGGTLYTNCNNSGICTALSSVTGIDGGLTTDQNTMAAGGTLNASDCFVGRPDDGSLTFLGGSCQDAGWNVLFGAQGDCQDICRAAWADADGAPRAEPQLVGICSLDPAVIGGDAANDIGPFEQ